MISSTESLDLTASATSSKYQEGMNEGEIKWPSLPGVTPMGRPVYYPSEMSTTKQDLAKFAQEIATPEEEIIAVTTEDGVLIYDQRHPVSWITSSVAVAIADTR